MLFTLFLNDLEHFLHQHTPGINADYIDDDISVFLKLFILLYADDTFIFGENPEEHQQSLNAFQKYCEIWKLTVNTEKTKVMIFSNGRISNNKELEIASEFKYLGIYLSRSGAFNAAKKHIAEQANKALFSLIRKTRTLNLSYDVQIDLFEKTIKPILLYGCEIWGFGNNPTIERVHLKFLKIIFRLKRLTPSFMILES